MKVFSFERAIIGEVSSLQGRANTNTIVDTNTNTNTESNKDTHTGRETNSYSI